MNAGSAQVLQVSGKALAFIASEESDRIGLRDGLIDFVRQRSNAQVGLALWQALPPGALGDSPQGQAGPGHDYDFILEATTGDPSVEAISQTLVGLTDISGIGRTGSHVVGGLEHHIMSGYGAVALFCPLVRLPHLSAGGFKRYWLSEHAKFGRRDPESRYRQIHCSDADEVLLTATTGLSAAGFDGVAEAFFANLTEMRAKLNSPDIAGDAYADEQTFIDHSRSSFLPFEMVGQ